MPASRRRASARVAVAMVVTAVLSVAAAAAAQAAANPISITVNVGYKGFVKAQQWMPVTVDVTNRGQDVSGTVEVTTGNNTNGPPIGSVPGRGPGAGHRLGTHRAERTGAGIVGRPGGDCGYGADRGALRPVDSP